MNMWSQENFLTLNCLNAVDSFWAYPENNQMLQVKKRRGTGMGFFYPVAYTTGIVWKNQIRPEPHFCDTSSNHNYSMYKKGNLNFRPSLQNKCTLRRYGYYVKYSVDSNSFTRPNGYLFLFWKAIHTIFLGKLLYFFSGWGMNAVIPSWQIKFRKERYHNQTRVFTLTQSWLTESDTSSSTKNLGNHLSLGNYRCIQSTPRQKYTIRARVPSKAYIQPIKIYTSNGILLNWRWTFVTYRSPTNRSLNLRVSFFYSKVNPYTEILGDFRIDILFSFSR